MMTTAVADIGSIKIKTFNYKIRNTTFEGKDHLIVPVIMMTEGVHCGSGGAVFHSIDALGHFPEAWNGIPVCIFHPQKEDVYVSANSPDVIETQTVGRIFNTHVDGTKLKAECWIDVDKITEISPLAYKYIMEMRPLEVSVGVFTDDEPVEGTWGNEVYESIAHNHRPDHLALLPGGQGACSWEDGAGIRTNTNHAEKGVDTVLEKKQKRIDGFLATFTNSGYVDAVQKIQQKINMLDGMGIYYYVEEIFESSFVFYKEDSQTGERLYFKQGYSVAEDGVLTLSEEQTPVSRRTEYVPITSNSTNQKGVMGNMKVKAHIDSLISSGKFTEDERATLEGLEESIIMKFEPTVHEEEKEVVATFGREEAIAVLQETLKTPEQFLGLLPNELQDQFRSGLSLHQAQKIALVEKIVAFNQAYTADELKGYTMEALTKLASFIPDVTPDYSMMGVNGRNVSTSSEAPLMPVGIVGMATDKK